LKNTTTVRETRSLWKVDVGFLAGAVGGEKILVSGLLLSFIHARLAARRSSNPDQKDVGVGVGVELYEMLDSSAVCTKSVDDPQASSRT
jgi:hypothetical protein